MRLRTLLLAGAVVPLALSHTAFAAERGLERPVMILAQADEECTPGTECPPPADDEEAAQPAEEPVEEQQEQQAAPEEPVEDIQDQQAAPEEPVEDIQEQQAAPEEPVEEIQEQQATPEEPVEEQQQQQAAPEEPAEPLQDQQAAPEEPVEEQQQQQAAPEEPADQPQEQQAQPTVGACPPGTDCPPAEEAAAPQPAAEEDTTVEQQLEAQGDREEADSVRSLREQLLDQLQRAVGVPAAEEPRADRRRGDRDGDRWRRDRFYERDDRQGEVMERRGGGIIIRLEGGGIYVEPDVPDEGGRLLYGADDVEVEQLRGGYTRTTVYRRNGTQIITVRDRYGDIVLRTRVLPDGREIVLVDNRFRDDRGLSPIVRIPPPRIGIPREEYIVDLGRASRQDIRRALLAPPVDTIEQQYTLQEVLRNQEIRAYSPRIDLDTITFEFGSATIGVDQMPTLFALGEVMEDILRENQDEMYLVEGHTDLVGTDYDNLLLSHRRAEAVAVALSQNFDIPPENLITEGYGEQYPKIATEAPERRNRRAAVLRLTDLIAQN